MATTTTRKSTPTRAPRQAARRLPEPKRLEDLTGEYLKNLRPHKVTELSTRLSCESTIRMFLRAKLEPKPAQNADPASYSPESDIRVLGERMVAQAKALAKAQSINGSRRYGVQAA